MTTTLPIGKQVAVAAAILIRQNGSTTSLEVKTMLRNANLNDPSYRLTQHEVSIALNDFFNENQGTIEFENVTVNGATFRKYQLCSNPVGSLTINQPIIAAANPTSIGKQPNKLDPNNGSIIGYVSGQPGKYIQASSKTGLKKAVFTEYSPSTVMTYDNINICRVELFNKKYCI